MCMTFALSAPGVGLVATDTRYTWDARDDRPRRVRDLGQKLRRVPGGWAAATGNTAFMLYGLRALERTGVRDVAASRDALRTASAWLRGRLDPEEKMENIQAPCWLLAREGAGVFSIHSSDWDGEGLDQPDSSSGQWSQLTTWPKGVVRTPAMQEAEDGLGERLRTLRSVWDLLRAVGWAFDFGASRCDTMSAEVELGITTREGAFYTRRPASWIAAAADRDLFASLSTPPQVEPFPRAAAERLVFRVPAAA